MKLPTDENGNNVPLAEAEISLSRSNNTSIATATAIAKTAGMSFIEVTAYDGIVALKYNSTVSTSDFDEIITENATIHRVIPASITSFSIIEITSGAKALVIQK